MVAKKNARSLVKSTFPGHDALIERAYRADGSFRDLCQDYRNCAAALERWRCQRGDQALQRTCEYAALLAELSKELESWLGALEYGAAPLRPGGAG